MRTKAEVDHVVGIKQMEKRESVFIPKWDYDTVARFILTTIRSDKREMITLDFLLDKAQSKLKYLMHSGTYWMLLQVKQDLQAKEIINITFKHRKQFISLGKYQLEDYSS